MKNSHKFWLIILIPLIIYLCFVSTIFFFILLIVEFVFGVFFFFMFLHNDLIFFIKNDKQIKLLVILNPICWMLLAIAYFNKWIDNEL